MSVLEIIDQIRPLPPEKREAVASSVENLKTQAHSVSGQAANDEPFEEAANHVLENYGSLLQRLAK